MRVLITGAAGFIGHHVVERWLATTDHEFVILDRLDHSGNLNRLDEIGVRGHARVRFLFHDLRAALGPQLAARIGRVDYVLHLAACTHVDRAIQCPMEAVLDNVVGTCNLLDFAREHGCDRFLYFSTDEVFGPAAPGTRFREWDRYRSGNPYAAAKAGGEELAIAYANTYRVPAIVTHTMNVFGRRQHPEKMIPGTIRRVRDGERVVIHADKTRTKAGSRFYIHADAVADALQFVLAHGEVGEKYNIVGEREVDNLELALDIAAAVGKTLDYELVDFHSSRPGHDLRYALDGTRLAEMGWKPKDSFHVKLKETVKWSLENPSWLLS